MGQAARHAPPPLRLHEGASIAGKYRLVEARGAGAMGAVWSATDVESGRSVAIKFLRPSTHTDPDAHARFEREARLAAQLGETSRNISRVIDHGLTDAGVPFLVMELLEGEELAARLRREQRMSLEATAKVVAQLCRALAVAHAAGVVHRDVKPANVFLCTISRKTRRWMTGEHDDLLVKLMDFGVAKALFDEADIGEEETTRAGTVIGTPAYMSPEQVLARALDARSDLWGVAATVYRMLVGSTPFGNGGFGELAVRIVASDPVPMSELVPELPKELDRWMATGLAKRPEDRFQNAHELSASLTAIAERASPSTSSARGPRPRIVARAAGESAERLALHRNASGVRTRVRQGSSFGTVVALVLSLVAAVLAGGVYAGLPQRFALAAGPWVRLSSGTAAAARAMPSMSDRLGGGAPELASPAQGLGPRPRSSSTAPPPSVKAVLRSTYVAPASAPAVAATASTTSTAAPDDDDDAYEADAL